MEPTRTRSMLIFTILCAAFAGDAGASFASSSAYRGFYFKHDLQRIQGKEALSAGRGRNEQPTFADLSLPTQRTLSEEQYKEDFSVAGWLGNVEQFHRSYWDDYAVRKTGTPVSPASPIPEPPSIMSLFVGLGFLAREVWRSRRGPHDGL